MCFPPAYGAVVSDLRLEKGAAQRLMAGMHKLGYRDQEPVTQSLEGGYIGLAYLIKSRIKYSFFLGKVQLICFISTGLF